MGGFTDKATADLDHDYAVAIDTLNSDTATKTAKKKAQKYLDNIQAQYGFNEAVEYDSNGNRVALSKRIQQAGVQRFSQEDSEYMELAKDPEKNEYRLDQMVGHAAFNAGYKQMMFHETSADNIHVFDISRGDHSATDSETPYGIFTKSRDNNIGIGDRQMKLYVKAENTLNVASREYVSKYIPDLVPYYDESKCIDDKYGRLADKALDMEMERLEAWSDAHPDADMEELLPLDYIIDNKPAKIDDAAYLAAHKNYEDVMAEWTKASDVVRVKCKDIITDYLRDNGYDSMYLFIDAGSNGRQTDALIVLDENQVKSANTVTYDDNGNVIPLSERFNSGNNDIRFSIDESFLNQVDEWNANGRDDETVFTLGTTGNTLQALGAIENDIYMNSEKVNRILNDHPEMDVETIKLIPKIIDDPTLILNSKNTVRNPTRVVMFSSVKDTKGIPVLAVLDLRPVENGFVVDDMQKLTSAYGKNVNAVDFVKNSEVLFAKEKRIASLLRTIGFTMPMELKDNNPYVGSISYKGQNVNIRGKAFENVFAQTQRNSTEDSDGNALTDQQQEDDYIRYSREMDEKAKVNFGSMFSGTGTVDFALRNMVNHRFAIEYDRQIAGAFKSNNGDEIFIGDVRDAVKQGYLDDKDVEYFHASPVCKNFSSQKHDSGEQPIDISTAQAVADAIDSLGPKIFTLENVKGYRNSRAVNIVKDALTRNGYVFDEHVYRASDYGGSTIRERYFIRAVKDVSEMPPMPEKVQGMSWYDTVSDLIPELPEWPMKAGGYMETRWNAIKDQVDTSRPVLILRGTKGGSLVYAEADEFSPTIIASDSKARIFMPDGRVLRATPRVLARIQGLPDSFNLPKQTSLANKVIGNGIPIQLTQAVAGSLLGQVDGVNDIRFSQEDEEFVRYSREADPETLEFLNNQELVPVYRAMQLIDGKLYPPMAAVVNGSLVEPAEPGVWYTADEHPELIKLNDKGKPQFNLNKGIGKGLAAAYNPYWHTSSTPLNDQFTSAYDRPNLVVVKGYVPKSELSSGYRAQYAKDPVGIAKWHAGTVDGKLRKIGKGRQVILSRYFILDDNPFVSEKDAAAFIREQIGDSGITVPLNIVTPSLRRALEAEGVTIDRKSAGKTSRTYEEQIEYEKSQRFSQEDSSLTEQNIREENEYLKGAYASLLTEVRTNKGSAAKMRSNSHKAADSIRDAYESRINKSELRDRIDHLVQGYIIGGEQNEAVAYQNAKNEAVDIARDIVNNAGRMKNADEYDRYLDLKKRVKNNDDMSHMIKPVLVSCTGFCYNEFCLIQIVSVSAAS